MAQLFTPPFQQTLDANANAISGAKLFFYRSGTTTPQAVYANDALTVPLTMPVVADAAGRFAPIYLDPSKKYRVVVADASGAPIRDVDPIGNAGIADLADGEGLNLVGFTGSGPIVASRTALAKARETVSAEDYYLPEDGSDDWPGLTRGIAYLNTVGGGELLLTKPAYSLSQPLNMERNVVIRGKMQGTTLTCKSMTGSAVTGVRCVVSAGSKQYWGLHNVTLVGDRVKTGATVTGANYGLYAEYSGYFEVTNVRADYCLEGFRFNQCQTFGVTQAVALRCSGYGFRLYNSCTSFRLKGCSPWACGGGFSLTACIYGSIDSPFVENLDNGKLPGGADTDVFGDSGGDCYNPGFMFECIGVQGLTIISPGGENNCSQWLYAEGSQIVIGAPHLFNTKAFNGSWRLIQLRGTARSNVTIINPHGFDEIIQRVPSEVAPILIEDPKKQKLQITGRWYPRTFTSPTAVSAYGVYDETAEKVVDLTRQKLLVGGGLPFIKSNAADVAEAVVTAGTKRVHLRASTGGNGARMSIPLAATEGVFLIRAEGFASGLAAAARLTLAEYNATGGLIGDLKTLSANMTANDGEIFRIGAWATVAAATGNHIALDVVFNSTTEDFSFTSIELFHIAGQQ